MDPDQYSNALAGPDSDDEDDSSHFVRGIAAGAHHVHSQSDASNFAAHTDFGRPELSIDPNLSAHPPPPRPHEQQLQRHQRQDDPHHHQHGQHGHYVQYSDLTRDASQYTLGTPSDQLSERSPSQFASASPAPNRSKSVPSFTPTDRSLPDKRVTDESLDDAYVAFILYCNPSVPLECDTAELRKVFRQPPKSDGKTFSTYHLLQLIEKFERKDIKTWTKLAIELGVERTPDSSAQKVQQYAVRLKRWMHAMHVDAFFEYILDKPHKYYQQIPSADPDTSNPGTAERIRDGVPVEEDLALRALHPETRPKRGRRKTDDKDDNSEKDGPAAKRQHLDTGTPASAADEMAQFVYPNSAVPSSAGGDGMSFLDDAVTQDQWTAATQVMSAGSSTPTGGQHYRWRAYPKMDSATTPHSPHPPPLLITHDLHNSNDEAMTPVSATPTSGKPARRRRHGPAVSSAWPSSGNPLTGKLRGRPPSNRSVRDGPFSTFPANPSAKGGATINMSPVTATPTPTPVMSHPPPHQFPQFRPHGLQLTVPQLPSRPIVMASPAVERHSNESPHMEWLQPPQLPKMGKTSPNIPPAMRSLPLDEMQRRFAVAILQAIGGDGMGVRLNDANIIAEKVFSGFRRAYTDFEESGIGEKVALLTGISTTEAGFNGLQVRRLQSELELLGIHDPDAEADDDNPEDDVRMDRGERRYQVRWETMFGGLKGEMEQIVVLPPQRRASEEDFEGLTDFGHDEVDADGKDPESMDELRKKVLELEGQLKGKEKELGTLRGNVLRAVVL
ncbi:ARS binding protein 2-domain-containing protein [Tricharina praecox]|uniref:ARS binding protein 2-domain-containing protein n=1 Tax=Tricharina praecox TaxID=43433 RepID=UPI002220357B|nr:ARS binding protein 2-domain-containing protein [Tricharina praecox]KAI5852286.1 ARS binding protein 2-domain-containing protein [Tricharina praecox]